MDVDVRVGRTWACLWATSLASPAPTARGQTLDELQAHLREVIAMLLEDGEPVRESDFVGLQQIVVPA